MEDQTSVKLEILETNGDIIQTFSNKSKENKLNVKSGGNQFVWNMRHKGFKEFLGMVLYSSPNIGPKAVPGHYVARLTVNEKSMDQEFEIVKDPRVSTTNEEFKKQFDFLVTVRDEVSKAHQAILDIRSIRKDIEYMKDKFEDNEEFKELIDLANQLDNKMSVIDIKPIFFKDISHVFGAFKFLKT